MRYLAGIGLMLLLCASARAWSNKEHILLTRLAAARLIQSPDTPEPMKQWLLRGLGGKAITIEEAQRYFIETRVGLIPRGVDGLPFWATYPDMMALADKSERKLEPFGVSEQKLHFIDLEFFNPDPAKRTYADDLSARPKAADVPRDLKDERYKQSGMLPFTVEHHHRLLVKALKEKRLDDAPGQFPRDDHAIRWAGCLAHYLQDNTQPQHATEDYQSKSYFKQIKDPKKAPNVHSDMEYRLLDDDNADYVELRKQLWEEVAKALGEMRDEIESNDPWQATLEVSLASYEALPIIGRAAQAAYPEASDAGPGAWKPEAFFWFKGTYRGKEMTVMQIKARQLAWAVLRTERLWKSAWEEAQK